MVKIKAAVFMGMNPWRLSEIHDTVRFLAAACTGVDRFYIDPPRGLKGAVNDPAYLLGTTRWRQEDCDGITVCAPPMGFAPVFLGLRKMADGFAATKLDRMLQQLYGASWREHTLLYISSWSYTQTNFIKKLQPKHLLFHILDDSFAFPLIKDYPRVLAENKFFYNYMMDKSSAVIAVSRELSCKYSALYNRPVQVVKNGVNVEHFRRQGSLEPIAEMAGIPQPVLMYVGSINSWVDLPLLISLADARPGYSLVLIGHYYEGTTDAGLWQELLQKTNVYRLKSKPYASLPGYINYASALLLPRTDAEHSQASDPLKLYEYLSTGKPVVSTALPAIDDFREFVYVSNHSDFAATVDIALKERDPAMAGRQAKMMERHSWHARVKEIGNILHTGSGISF
ncbi:MAG: putative teichuronic acid biosynthesis glycosyltransferase TuaH [Pelotomaculum sp. PtaU1.Bin035]|nr:MAG: putative teichuronic acid biosynthesis glycosyltransferase TuaH [Pelotomaculum sp. PtaU1.Bin035]